MVKAFLRRLINSTKKNKLVILESIGHVIVSFFTSGVSGLLQTLGQFFLSGVFKRLGRGLGIEGSTAERLDAKKLRETLGRSLQNRKPVISERLEEKVNEVARMVNDALNRGESIMVVLKGEEGVGKTVALYLICERLLASGRELYWTDRFATQGTLKVLVPSGKVLVVDDIAERKLDLPSDVTIIATARTHLWEPSERWVEVELLVGDQDQRGILKSMLNAKEVKYTEGGVEELLREPRTPLYLDALTDELRQRGEELNEANAAVMPSGVRETITGIMNNLWERDRLSAALLCCLAHTETGWLHFAQLESLKSLTKKLGFEGDGSYEDLLYSVGYSKGLKHGGWARVLRDYAEGRQELRGLDLRGLVRESCLESLKHMGRLRASSAAELAARAVENFPDLAIKVLDAALEQEKDKRDMVMDAVALRAPGKIGEWLRKRGYDWKGAFDLASDMEAPSARLEIYGFAEGPLRELVKSDERFKPYLAMALNSLGISYYLKGMLDRAIELHERARSIYEELVKSDERFKPDLAMALNSLGISYSDKGMLDRAIELQEEARSIYEELSRSDERFKPYLAMALNSLGKSYSRKGMLDRAIELQERARSIYEELAELDERFKPDLAGVLNSLGISYSDKGMLDRAIELHEEARSIYEELAELDERFKPDLAGVLNSLGISYSRKGMLDRAIELQKRAKSIYEELARFDERFKPDLAVVLNNLGLSYHGKGMLDRAIELYKEARSIYEELVKLDERFKPDLANTLLSKAFALFGKGNLEEALSHICEAYELLSGAPETQERNELLEIALEILRFMGKSLEDCGGQRDRGLR